MIKHQIQFENADMLVINKMAGESFHSDQQVAGVATRLQMDIQHELWPVHRLDKMTSGLLLFAKSHSAAVELNTLFQNRKIDKTYLALSDRKPKKKQGKICGDMVKSRNGCWKLTSAQSNPAITEFKSCSLLPGQRFFWVKPQSGKTHQIRVALKALGAPILGDVRYGGSEADRGYLHAYRLSFQWKGEQLNLTCLPDSGELFCLPELQNCINKFTDS